MQKSFKYYVNSIRIQQAVSLYRSRDFPNIADIAMACGFDNIATFYRAFREVYGMSPKIFFNSISTDSIQYNNIPAEHMVKHPDFPNR